MSPLTPDDLAAIEATAREIVTNCPEADCVYCVTHHEKLALVAEVRRLRLCYPAGSHNG